MHFTHTDTHTHRNGIHVINADTIDSKIKCEGRRRETDRYLMRSSRTKHCGISVGGSQSSSWRGRGGKQASVRIQCHLTEKEEKLAYS
jgi:hypothetical protein